MTAPGEGIYPDNPPHTMPPDELRAKYPFVDFFPSDRAQYVPPEYYDRLLKPYTFGGVEDLGLMRPSIAEIAAANPTPVVLELGGGTGRATAAALQFFGEHGATPRYFVNDLSPDMIDDLRRRFASQYPGFTTFLADHIEMLEALPATLPPVDYLFSQWSLSHSVHQHIERLGEAQAAARVEAALRTVIDKSLAPGAKMHIIHFDTDSPEQRILVRQWSKYFWEFRGLDPQSHSKDMLDRIFKQIAAERDDISLRIVHHQGDPIEYANLYEALEIFLNFHMEGELNRHPDLPQIIAELEADLLQHQQSDGRIFIAPGCFTYELEKAL